MNLDTSLWLDSVRAVPTIGVRLEPTFDHVSKILDRLKPLIKEWSTDPATKLTVEDHFLVKIEKANGYELRVRHDNVLCKFYHINELVEKGHRLGQLKYRSEPLPMRNLIAGAQQCINSAISLIWGGERKNVKRIGVLVGGSFDAESPPPGFADFIEHLGSPWGRPLSAFINAAIKCITQRA